MSSSNGIPISFKPEFTDTKKALSRIREAPHRATMWALRDAARLTKKTAVARAPRYKGKAYPSISGGLGKKGALKKSIRVAQKFKEADPIKGYSIRVFPYGKVYSYRGKIEQQVGYMEAGRDAAIDALPEIYERSIRKALKL